MLLHLCTTTLQVDWPIIVNVQGLKEAKTKQIDIKLGSGVSKCLFCYKVVIKLFFLRMPSVWRS